MRMEIKISEDALAKIRGLAGAAAGLPRALVGAFGRASQMVLGNAVQDRFTGRGPFPVSQHRLGIVTNNLRKSLRATAVQLEAGTGAMSVRMGSQVEYYAPHEFGYSGTVTVRAHTRRSRREGGAPQAVRAHSRRVNVPARRPMATELGTERTKKTIWGELRDQLERFLSGI